MDDRYYLHLFNSLPQFGPVRLGRLARHFPDFATAYEAAAAELAEAGVEPEVIGKWLSYKKSLEVEREIKQLNRLGVGLLTYTDEAYPRLLRQISQPPPLLYYRGKIGPQEELCIGAVGTRKITAYGTAVVPRLIGPLVETGVTVVSGLAYGVDALVHRTTLERGGRTIAVLGGGLDDRTLYPYHHVKLAHEILDNGGLLFSEYPPGRAALKQHFVVRNRVIAGLAAGVVVIECGLKSGALITAKYAFDEDRPVYAVPGPIYAPGCQGTNNLLKQKQAQAVTDGADIVADLNLEQVADAPENFSLLTTEEQAVLMVVGRQPVQVDQIIAALPLDAQVTTAALTFLEIKGHVKNLGAQQYVRVR